MATIKFTKKHPLGAEKAKELVLEVVESLDGKLDVEYYWEGNTIRLESPGLRGFIDVQPEEIEIQLNLGLLYRPFKSQIESRLREYLERLLGC